MKNLSDKITFAVFVVFIFTALAINLILPQRSYSESEKRALTTFSASALKDSSPSDALECAVKDQFFLRDKLRELKSAFERHFISISRSGDCAVKDDNIIRLYYPYDTERIANAKEYISTVCKRYLDGCDNLYISVIPSKSELADLPSLSSKSTLEYLKNADDRLTLIDIYSSLSIESYYLTDIHWRCERILGVAKILNKAMKSETTDESELHPVKAGDFVGSLSYQASLKSAPEEVNLLSSDTIDSLRVIYKNGIGELYDISDENTSSDFYNIFMKGEVLDKSLGNNIIIIKNENAKAERRLIIFRDSFTRSIAPLLMKGYSEAVLIDVRTPSALLSKGNAKTILDSIDKNTDILFLLSMDMLLTTDLK